MGKNKGKRVTLPKLIILVGTPGSGKSFFTKHLMNRYNKDGEERIVSVSRDELKTTAKCDEVLVKGAKSSKKVIVDRCNITAQDRENIAKYSMVDKNNIVVIYFDYPPEVCIERVKNRVGHPTIKFGRGENAVNSFHKKLEPPTEKEGFKKVITIKSFEESNDLLVKLGCDRAEIEKDVGHTIIKFPRTHHIFDAGGSGVTRDDLVLSKEEIKEYLNCELTLEEKVDGANLGMSIDRDYNIIYQNRSHYVTYSSASQFKGLKKWEETHAGELYQILKPNRHILYGEWCYAKHSIHYTDLPNYFLAFDIFDKYENKFFSRQKFYEIMSQTSIPTVPVIDKVTFKDDKELKDRLMGYLDSKSKFRDGHIEGVYIRKDDGDFLERRCKLVRPDFVQGIDTHWSKMTLVKNVIKYY